MMLLRFAAGFVFARFGFGVAVRTNYQVIGTITLVRSGSGSLNLHLQAGSFTARAATSSIPSETCRQSRSRTQRH